MSQSALAAERIVRHAPEAIPHWLAVWLQDKIEAAINAEHAETVERCAQIAEKTAETYAESGDFGRAKGAEAAAAAIRREFGLEEKP